MNINNVFPSKYLKAADLQSREFTLRIASIRLEDIGDDDQKPVLYFENAKKGLVLNKTNANNCVVLYGAETDGWIGKPITLYSAWVDFQGRSVEAIRIRPAPGVTIGQYQHQKEHSTPLPPPDAAPPTQASSTAGNSGPADAPF